MSTNAAAAKWKAKNMASGLCRSCPAPATDGVFCRAHAEDNRARTRAAKAARRERGTSCLDCDAEPISGSTCCEKHAVMRATAVGRLGDPPASSESVRRRMQGQRTKDTSPEIGLRKHLFALGLRYRLHVRLPIPYRCEADIVFPRARIAVFVDGCWWHRCPDCNKGSKAHSEWWETKFARTSARDERNNRALEEAGWLVVRAWEHEDPAAVAARVLALLSR